MGVSQKKRLRIKARQNFLCGMCSDLTLLTIHHILYQRHGGSDDESNLIALCLGCHAKVHADDTDQHVKFTGKQKPNKSNLLLQEALLLTAEALNVRSF